MRLGEGRPVGLQSERGLRGCFIAAARRDEGLRMAAPEFDHQEQPGARSRHLALDKAGAELADDLGVEQAAGGSGPVRERIQAEFLQGTLKPRAQRHAETALRGMAVTLGQQGQADIDEDALDAALAVAFAQQILGILDA